MISELFYVKYVVVPIFMLITIFFVRRLSISRIPIHKRKRVMQAILFFTSFLVFFSCLAPGLSGDDSGEYALKTMKLGLAHGGGYPFYLVLGKIFAIPFGKDFVYALNFMSALFSAMSIVVLFRIIHRISKNEQVSFFLSLNFAFVIPFWTQATMVEVANINTFIGLLFIYFLLINKEINRIHPLFSFFTGLATGIYFPIILMFPAMYLFILLKGEETILKRLGKSIFGVICMIIGISIVAAVTITMARQEYPLGTLLPPVDLISLLKNWMGQNANLKSIGPLDMLKQLIRFLSHYIFSFLAVTFFISIYGFYILLKKDKKITIFLITILLINGLYVYTTGVVNYELMTNICYACISISASVGYIYIFEKNDTVKKYLLLFVCCAPLLTYLVGLFQVNSILPEKIRFEENTQKVDKSSLVYFETFTHYLFDVLPSNAIIFSNWPEMTSIRYLQAHDERRNDIRAYERRDGMWYEKRMLKDWRGYVKEKANQLPIYITAIDHKLAKSMNFIPVSEKLWRVNSSQNSYPSGRNSELTP